MEVVENRMIWNYRKGFGIGLVIGLGLVVIYFGFGKLDSIVFVVGIALNNAVIGTGIVLPFLRLLKKFQIGYAKEGGFAGASVVLIIVDVILRGMPFAPPPSTGLMTSFTIDNLNMWTGLATLLASIATLVTVAVLIVQTNIIRKQNRLAYGPVLIPRYIWNNTDSRFHIFLFNVGKGHALDINLQFKNESGDSIGRGEVQAYGLLNVEIETYNEVLGQSYREKVDTGISFASGETLSFEITGWYRDAYGDKIKADRKYEFPPRFV